MACDSRTPRTTLQLQKQLAFHRSPRLVCAARVSSTWCNHSLFNLNCCEPVPFNCKKKNILGAIVKCINRSNICHFITDLRENVNQTDGTECHCFLFYRRTMTFFVSHAKPCCIHALGLFDMFTCLVQTMCRNIRRDGEENPFAFSEKKHESWVNATKSTGTYRYVLHSTKACKIESLEWTQHKNICIFLS